MKPPYKDLESLRSGSVIECVAYLRERKLHAGYDPEILEILFLMAAMDTFMILEWGDADNSLKNDSWQPKSDQVRECIQRLIASENRDALRKWYGRFSDSGDGKMMLNSAADHFRRYLSNLIGEEL